MILSYKIHELTDYINWIYFFHAWGFQPRFASIADIHGCDTCRALWLRDTPVEDRPKAAEAMQLFKEAQRMLWKLDEDYQVHAMFRLCEANADGDDLLLDGMRFPLLRQQSAKSDNSPSLCLSDFVRPLSSGQPDTVGVFATTVDEALEQLYENDPYQRMLVHVLAERLAEAAAERIHEQVFAGSGLSDRRGDDVGPNGDPLRSSRRGLLGQPVECLPDRRARASHGVGGSRQAARYLRLFRCP